MLPIAKAEDQVLIKSQLITCNDYSKCKPKNLDIDLQGLVTTLIDAVKQKNQYLLWKLDAETKSQPFRGSLDSFNLADLFSEKKLAYGNSVRTVLVSGPVISYSVEDISVTSRNSRVRVYFYAPNKFNLKLPLTEKDCDAWQTAFVTAIFNREVSGWSLEHLFERETDNLC